MRHCRMRRAHISYAAGPGRGSLRLTAPPHGGMHVTVAGLSSQKLLMAAFFSASETGSPRPCRATASLKVICATGSNTSCSPPVGCRLRFAAGSLSRPCSLGKTELAGCAASMIIAESRLASKAAGWAAFHSLCTFQRRLCRILRMARHSTGRSEHLAYSGARLRCWKSCKRLRPSAPVRLFRRRFEADATAAAGAGVGAAVGCGCGCLRLAAVGCCIGVAARRRAASLPGAQ